MAAGSLDHSCISTIILSTLRSPEHPDENARNLRLVNRFFNDEVLRFWYVTNAVRPPKVQRGDTAHNRMSALRLLQGALVRHGYDVVRCPSFLISIKEATSQLRTLTSTMSVRSTTPTNSFSRDDLDTVVCEAIVSLYGQEILMYADLLRWPKFGVEDHGTEGWKLLAACKIGDLDLLKTCYYSFSIQNLPKGDHDNILRSSLSTAIKEDWHTAFDFLLHSSVDLTTKQPITHLDRLPLCAAAVHGRIDCLRALLTSDDYMQKSPSFYEAALIRAVKHPSQSCRAQMVKILFQHGATPQNPRFRHEVVFAACRLNDTALIKLMLEDGHVDMYSSTACRGVGTLRRSILRAAVGFKSVDCLRLILVTAPPEDQPNKAEVTRQLRIAYARATNIKHIESMKILLPHLTEMSYQEKYDLAKRTDGGIAALEEICGSRDRPVTAAQPACD